MNDRFEGILLEKYDLIHKRSSLDKSLLEGINVSDVFLQKFRDGASSLFLDLKKFQPITYESLLCCIDLWLLESNVHGGDNLFTLAIVFNDHIITSQMINKRYIERRAKTGKVIPSSMSSLNKELHAYYSVFNGLSFPLNNNPIGLKNYSLPDSLGSWLEIDEFCKEYSVDKSIFNEVKKINSHSLLVWISSANGDLFLITDDKSSSDVYKINYKTSNEFIKLKDPVNDIDQYCSKVIKGALSN